jgi:ABC-type Fe3+ transport system permease subunit
MLSVVAIILVVGLVLIFVARHPSPGRRGGFPSQRRGRRLPSPSQGRPTLLPLLGHAWRGCLLICLAWFVLGPFLGSFTVWLVNIAARILYGH